MAPSIRDNISEVVRRLNERDYCNEDICEAAGVIANLQTQAESLAMGEEFLASLNVQIAKLGFFLIQTLSSTGSSKALKLLSLPATQARLVALGLEATLSGVNEPPPKLGYDAMANIIKMWIHEEANRPPKPLGDWLPRQ